MRTPIASVVVLLLAGCANTPANEPEQVPMAGEAPMGIGVRLVEQTDGTWIVDTVYAGSPAAEAGITVGDSVMSVNGKTLPARELDCVSTWFALQQWGAEVEAAREISVDRITYVRGGSVFEEAVPVAPLDELMAVGNASEASGCKMCWSGCPSDYSGYVTCKPGFICNVPCRIG